MPHMHDHKGFTTRGIEPQVVSNRSVLSGNRLTAGAYSIPVPGRPGFWYRLTPGEQANLTAERLQAIVAKCNELFPPAEPSKRSKSAD